MVSDLRGAPAVMGHWEREKGIDTPQPEGMRILGSPSPLSLDPLRYLSQRWFSRPCFNFRYARSFVALLQNLFDLNAVCLAPMKILPIPGKELELWNRTLYLQLSNRVPLPLGEGAASTC